MYVVYGGGHWDFRFWLFFRSVFRFWCSLQFSDFSFFSIRFSVLLENNSGFSVLLSNVVFGFSNFESKWSFRFWPNFLFGFAVSNILQCPPLYGQPWNWWSNHFHILDSWCFLLMCFSPCKNEKWREKVKNTERPAAASY